MLAFVLPVPVRGWFDGLPWDQRPEMLAAAYGLPLVAAFRFRAFASRMVGWLALGALAGKLVLAGMAPREGLGVRVFENEETFSRGQWEKTWETLWAPGFSATVRRDWTRAGEFPVEWANRYDQPHRLASGLWLGEQKRMEARPIVEVSGWVWLEPGETLDLGLGPDLRVRRISWDGEEIPPNTDDRPVFPVAVDSGWHALRAEFQMGSLFSETAVLAPVAVSESGGRVSVLGGLRSSPERLEPGAGRGWTQGIILLNHGTVFLMLAAGLSLLISLFRSLPAGRWAPFFGLSLLAGLGPWFGRMAGLELTGTLVYGLIPALLFGLFVPGLMVELGPARLVFWILGLGMLPVWIAADWAGMTSATFFAVGDDWLAQQNLARAVFVQRDWLSLVSEKLYVYQPGYRYLTGGLHLLFGSSAWPSRMLDLFSVVTIASLVPVLCLWAGARAGLSAWMGFLTYAAYGSRPPFQLMGQCIHEYVATAALLVVACLLASWHTLPAWRLPTLLSAVAVAYLVRQNHAPAILACATFLSPRSAGGWAGIFGALREKARENWRPALWLFLGVFALALLVCLRNWYSAGIFHINSPGNLSALTGESPSTFSTTLGLVLRAKDQGWSHMGLLVSAGLGAALLTLGFRVGFVKRVPVEPALLLLAALAPFAVIRLLPVTTRFSFVLVPLAAVCLGALLAGLRPRERLAS